MKQKLILLLLLIMISALLSGCNRPAELTATPPPPSPTVTTAAPTEKPAESTASPTPAPTATDSVPAVTIAPPKGEIDALAFVDDVTVPDGTSFRPGENFVKIWRLRNVGDTTWNSDYALVFEDGSDMGGPLETPLDGEVAPGEELEISVELTAPDTPGEMVGYWMLRNSQGEVFGSGEGAAEAFWVAIIVLTEEGDLPDFEGAKITFANLIVNQENYTGPCPVTLTFTGDMNFDGEGDVTYQFKAGAQDSDLIFDTSDPETITFDYLDTHTVFLFFTLELSRSVEGWARVLVTAPNNFSSSPIYYSVTCNP